MGINFTVNFDSTLFISKFITFHSAMIILDKGINSIYYNKDATENWLRFVVGAYNVQNFPNIVCLWVTGDAAKHMESLDIETVKKDSMNLLRDFLGNIPEFKNLKDPINIQV